MKKKVLIVLLIIILIALVLGTMYLIDRKMMKNNKPVIFSTWGYSYTPPVSTYSSNPTINVENNYSKTIDNITIELNIPNDWHYEELPRNEENDFYKFALKLYKSDSSKNTILYYYTGPFGVCGTGRTDKKMYLNNGAEAGIGYYDNSKVWSDISFYPLNTNIAFLNGGLEGNEAQEVLDFVKSIRIIDNTSTIKESDRKTENVKLEIKEGTLTNTGATVIITDKNENPYGWGVPYFIEIEEDGIWAELENLLDFAWIEIAYELDENGQYEQEINWEKFYGELKPGNYRLVKNVYDNGYINFYVEFTIE